MAEPRDKGNSEKNGYPRVRRETRTPATIPLSVSGFDESGHFFSEHTATLNVSTNGCCFRLQADIAPDALVALQSDSGQDVLPGHPVFYQVAWREDSDLGATVGAARTDGISPPAGKSSDTSGPEG
jgi:PilZ domain